MAGWVEEFPGNFAWSNAALVTKGMAPYGAVALREIDDACARLRERQAEPDAWREEWCALGARVEKLGDAAKNPRSAGATRLPVASTAT